MKTPNLILENKTVLITGAAGFIGANLAISLLTNSRDLTVIGVDSMNDYYDTSLKEYRLEMIQASQKGTHNKWAFIKEDISDKDFVYKIFSQYKFDIVVNLAAQAGVRYSILNPDAYIKSNIIGFYNILEACRHYPVKHLVFASSSSVYGMNSKVPYSTSDPVDHPVSLYAATKKSNELLAYSYSKLYKIPCTGLRFFTVYGPAGRPDMAYFSFTNKLLKNETIDVFNYGNCERDFTYIDDIVYGIKKVMEYSPDTDENQTPYNIYNIGNSHPENLLVFIDILSEELINLGLLSQDFNIKDHVNLIEMQPGDVPITFADVSGLESDFGFKPDTSLRAGLREFVLWYKNYYIDKAN